MENENSNSQTAPVNVPTSAGNTDESQVNRLAELERKSEGLLRDLQAERAKRQELEARLVTPAAPSPAPQQDVNNAELASLIQPVVAPMIAAHSAAFEAKQFLSSKVGKPWNELANDRDFQAKLESTINKYGISGDYYNVAVKAYEAMKRDEELETYRKREAAAAQAAQPSSTSLPSGAPPEPAKSNIEYDVESWKRLPVSEYDRLFALGAVRKVGDKIVITPR
jgi:hypothetical protein